MTRVVLASASPRRRELLAGLGVSFDVFAPDVDEGVRGNEDPVAYVARLAVAKACAGDHHDALVIAADTTVDVDGDILAKPGDADDARRMLAMLSGRTHRVHTGVAVRSGDRVEHQVVTTHVTFVELLPATIDWYVATGEPMGKAGAYAIQGAGGALVARIDGSVSNVIGLPMAEVVASAARVGRPLIR